MAFTKHQYTNVYECDAAENIIDYPEKVTIQMIICYFNSDGDQIKLTDDISASAGEDTTADDTIIHLYGDGGGSTQIINWSAKPRHFTGLVVATISSSNCRAWIYVA